RLELPRSLQQPVAARPARRGSPDSGRWRGPVGLRRRGFPASRCRHGAVPAEPGGGRTSRPGQIGCVIGSVVLDLSLFNSARELADMRSRHKTSVDWPYRVRGMSQVMADAFVRGNPFVYVRIDDAAG